jgi:site-specific DNA-methyltransferase (adenine-specific)
MPSFGDCELAWTNSPRTSVSKVVIEWNGLLGKEQARVHPTQKPLALMVWCVEKYSEQHQTVVDPFMGSGTTLRAAKDLGRKAIGIEIEERYCEIAAKRMEQEILTEVASPMTGWIEPVPLEIEQLELVGET